MRLGWQRTVWSGGEPAQETPPAPPVVTPPPTPAVDPPAPPANAPWALERIDTLTRHVRERDERLAAESAAKLALQRQLEASQAALRAMRAASAPPGDGEVDPPAAPAAPQPVPLRPGSRVVTPEEHAAIINREVAVVRATEKFNEQCDALVDAGAKAFPDFSDKMKALAPLGGVTVPLAAALIKFGDAGHKILHHLGSNLELASKVTKISDPADLALELKSIELALAAPVPPKITKTPAPMTPVDGIAESDKPTSEMNYDEWLAYRKKTSKLIKPGVAA